VTTQMESKGFPTEGKEYVASNGDTFLVQSTTSHYVIYKNLTSNLIHGVGLDEWNYLTTPVAPNRELHDWETVGFALDLISQWSTMGDDADLKSDLQQAHRILREKIKDPKPEVPVPALPTRINDQPPVHWMASDGWKRHPQTAEEWNWRKDSDHVGEASDRSEQRLNFAADQADPHAPDQMATVLRIDLLRLHGRMIAAEAYKQFHVSQKEAKGELVNPPAWLKELKEAAEKITLAEWTASEHLEKSVGTEWAVWGSDGDAIALVYSNLGIDDYAEDIASFIAQASPQNILNLINLLTGGDKE
jgi:hypothetical protein